MKTKKILIGAGVVIAGYLLWKQYKKNNPKQKKCLKWNQVVCVTAPCNPQCEQYEK